MLEKLYQNNTIRHKELGIDTKGMKEVPVLKSMGLNRHDKIL